ncbi:MAG: M23 family metallopeptidase [Candidatus Moraniibacteriota bacterium]
MLHTKASKFFLVGAMVLFIFGILFFRARNRAGKIALPVAPTVQLDNVPAQVQTQPSVVSDASGAIAPADFLAPLDRAKERITKKPFGIHITQANSPVQPERFSGYHTGTDFEIFPQELTVAVPVKAICTGKIIEKRWASGYGGVLVQSCQLKNQPITSIYGHLNLTSISQKIGDTLTVGAVIGELGQDRSTQTDGERKHLHLGVHKGANINILGYVQSPTQLSSWIDVATLLP